jgi:hypothetical protein
VAIIASLTRQPPPISAQPSAITRGWPGPGSNIGAVKFQDASPVVTTAADTAIGSLRYVSTCASSGDYLTFSNNLSGAMIRTRPIAAGDATRLLRRKIRNHFI